jgi:hypothetical protein
MNSKDFLNNLWKWKCGLPEEDTNASILQELLKTEWSEKFEKLMRNRLVFGAIRYGRIGAEGKPKYDRVESMINRISKYKESGNKEFLVDVANLCLLEFVECYHPKANFKSIDDGEHVKIINI